MFHEAFAFVREVRRRHCLCCPFSSLQASWQVHVGKPFSEDCHLFCVVLLVLDKDRWSGGEMLVQSPNVPCGKHRCSPCWVPVDDCQTIVTSCGSDEVLDTCRMILSWLNRIVRFSAVCHKSCSSMALLSLATNWCKLLHILAIALCTSWCPGTLT